MQPSTKKILAFVGVAFGLIAVSGVSDNTLIVAVLGTLAAGFTALGNFWERFAGNVWLTVLGSIAAVSGAVAPLLNINLFPSIVYKLAVLGGAVATAAGKGLFDTDVNEPPQS